MLCIKRLLIISCCLAASAFVSPVFAAATGLSPEQDSSTLLPKINPEPTTPFKVANLMYVTFRVPAGSGNQFQGDCPNAMTYVSGSGTMVPAIPGYQDQAMYYWQCIQNVNGWSLAPTGQAVGNVQPYVNTSHTDYTYAGTVPNAASPQSYHTEGIYTQTPQPVDWMNDMIDDASGATNYTYFQFPGNNFIPTGIGGSGIGCNTNNGDILTVSCKDSFGRHITTQADGGITPTSPIIFFIPAGTSATCQVTRTYGPNEYAACNSTVTIPSGQTKVMACCSGHFACDTSNWGDASLTTCLTCPTTVQCN